MLLRIIPALTLLAALAPAARAVVCNFDDLPQPAPGTGPPVPQGYCGINWFGSNGALYFSGSVNFGPGEGTFSPHSQPNASANFSLQDYSFTFQSPAVFTGFYATPSTLWGAQNNRFVLLIQFQLSLKGKIVYTGPVVRVPYPGGAFMSTGYAGDVDTVNILSSATDTEFNQPYPGGYFSVDDVTYTPDCSHPAISPNTEQDFNLLGGTGSVNVTLPFGCSWKATPSASWITVTKGASGTGNGTVSYSVADNTGAPRSGSLSIAGLSLPIKESGNATFTATDTRTNQSASYPNTLSPIEEGDNLTYSGQGWPTTGGPIQIYWGAT